jgi:hypothetical protein
LLLAAMIACALPQPQIPGGERPTLPQAPAAPAYFCPMKCEGEKTYSDPTVRCPVCHMKLKRVAAAPSLSVTPGDGLVVAGRPTPLKVAVSPPDFGRPVNAGMRNERVSLLLIAKERTWAAQRWPSLVNGKGDVNLTFAAPGDYTAMLIPASTGRPEKTVSTTIQVAPAKGAAPSPLPSEPSGRCDLGEGLVLKASATEAAADQKTRLVFTLERAGKQAPIPVPPDHIPQVVVLSKDLSTAQHFDADHEDGGITSTVQVPGAGDYLVIVSSTFGGSGTAVFPLRVR